MFPNQVFLVAYHPDSSNYTTPYNASDPDLRRAHPNALYHPSFSGRSAMPGAFVNRRKKDFPPLDPIRWQGGGQGPTWDSSSTEMMAESAPMNIGIASSYNDTVNELSIDIEAYFTSAVSDSINLHVLLTENNLVAEQVDKDSMGISFNIPNYIHNHVFREVFTGQWGEYISNMQSQASLISRSYNFDNSVLQYDMNNCEVIAYITVGMEGEVQTAESVAANGGTTTIINESPNNAIHTLQLFPNPTNELLFFTYSHELKNASCRIYDILGNVYTETALPLNNRIVVNDLHSGIYFLEVISGHQATTNKFIIQR